MRSLFPILLLLFVENVHSSSDFDADFDADFVKFSTREISPEWLSKVLSFGTNSGSGSLRALQSTGHVWKACSGNVTDNGQMVVQNNTEYTQSIYEHTSYDDGHEPACTCFYDKSRDEYWAQCALGDRTCDPRTGACTGTHEFFLFSDTNGNLQQKSSCGLCQDINNCEGIRETCTLVAFDEDSGIPSRCVLKSINDDGTQSVCDDCTICQHPQTNEYGTIYDCFGETTLPGTCDTSGTAHLHNFEPVLQPEPASASIGGTFRDYCNDPTKVRPFSPNTGPANYEDYTMTCDCQDPTAGTITCELSPRTATNCFAGASSCAEFTQIYYFDLATGEIETMITCDLLGTNLCTTVGFSVPSGEPLVCSLFSARTLENCRACTFCRDEAFQSYGIRYDCFGHTVGDNGACTERDHGHQEATDATAAPEPTDENDDKKAFVDRKPNISPTSPPNKNNDNYNNNRDRTLVLGLAIGGVAFAAFVAVMTTLVCRPNGPRPIDNEETLREPSAYDQQEGLRLATAGTDDPPEVLVDQDGRPMVEDPTPIIIT